MGSRVLISIFFLISFLNAETRYKDEIFSEVTKIEDVVYGNAPDLPFVFLFEWNTNDIDLKMDIYSPVGDTLTDRPIIVFLHSGGFVLGHNEKDDVVALSIASAKRGYVAVSINYRLGMNVLSDYSAERAVYRGVQDLSAAIRYLRENYLYLGIDREKVFVWGTSAGAFAGLHLTFIDEDERPESTFGGFLDPDLGCVDCEGNDYIHSSRPNALVSCWGAIGDLNWINEENNTTIIMFHGTADQVVPFNQGFPFSNVFFPFVYGSHRIYQRLNELNIENQIHAEQGLPHEYWGSSNGDWLDGPTEYFQLIKNDAYTFLFDLLYPYEIGDVNEDGSIDILDFTSILNFIINDSYPYFDLYYSDLNHDTFIDVFDLFLLLDRMN